jgi:hypothetical protein
MELISRQVLSKHSRGEWMEIFHIYDYEPNFVLEENIYVSAYYILLSFRELKMYKHIIFQIIYHKLNKM